MLVLWENIFSKGMIKIFFNGNLFTLKRGKEDAIFTDVCESGESKCTCSNGCIAGGGACKCLQKE
jgi:hypothetical protein